MDKEFQNFLDFLKDSNKHLLETISTFKSELKEDMKDSFKSVKEDINNIDTKLNKNMIYTTGELSTIKEQLRSVTRAQEAQEETILEIQKNQLTCKAINQWDTMVKAVSDLDKGLKKADDEITDIHSIEALRRKSGLDKNGDANGNVSRNPSKRSFISDLPRWLPILLALLTAAGIIGGAAAIKWARSDEANSVDFVQKIEEYEEDFLPLDTDYYTGELD